MSYCVIVWLKVFVSGLSTWLFPLSQSLKAILISRLCRLPQIFWQLTSPAVHKVPVPFCHYFQWTIHFITPFFIFIFSRELFHSSSVTVTQGPLRTSLLLQSWYSICSLLLSCWWSVLLIVFCELLHFFNSLSKWNSATFFCVNVAQV